MKRQVLSRAKGWFIILLLTLTLVGCGGGGGATKTDDGLANSITHPRQGSGRPGTDYGAGLAKM